MLLDEASVLVAHAAFEVKVAETELPSLNDELEKRAPVPCEALPMNHS